MALMLPARFLAAILLVLPCAIAGQAQSVLHIKILLGEAADTAAPVPRHVLLVSDNPSTSPPREVVTKADGTADVHLPPGNYTVESDKPLVFQGKAYQWTKTLDVPKGRDALLELTLRTAEAVPLTSATERP